MPIEVNYYPLSHELTDEERRDLLAFSNRVGTLSENWQDLNSGDDRITLSFNREPTIAVEGFNHNYFRLKGLFLDYRPFIAKKEPTEFGRICNLIARRAPHKAVRDAIEQVKKQWNSNEEFPLVGWHHQERKKVVDAFFNGELFHSDKQKHQSLSKIKETMSEEALQSILFLDIHAHVRLLKNVRFFLSPFLDGSDVIQIPKNL